MTKQTRMLPLLVYVALLLSCSRPQPSSDTAAASPATASKRLCKTAIMSLIDAHGMMSDENGKIIQLTQQQEGQMKALIRTGLAAGAGVSDDFLAQTHPQLPSEFRHHLLAGWQKYLDGLDHSSPADQVLGIQSVQRWEAFKEEHIDLLYERIIK